MRNGNGIQGFLERPARQRWARAILCLLFALSTVLFLGQSASAMPHSTVVHVESADGGAHPCDGDHTYSVGHCGTSSPCSFCAPLSTELSDSYGPATNPPVVAETLSLGCVTRPRIQPPRLSLQA